MLQSFDETTKANSFSFQLSPSFFPHLSFLLLYLSPNPSPSAYTDTFSLFNGPLLLPSRIYSIHLSLSLGPTSPVSPARSDVTDPCYFRSHSGAPKPVRAVRVGWLSSVGGVMGLIGQHIPPICAPRGDTIPPSYMCTDAKCYCRDTFGGGGGGETTGRFTTGGERESGKSDCLFCEQSPAIFLSFVTCVN